MKDSKRDTVLYKHIRKSDGIIFYIGIGSINRAYNKIYRNEFWKRTVNKHDYDVEIIADNLTWEEACKLEIMFISFYGRRDKSNGQLVNMTDGGDGVKGRIVGKKTRKSISEKQRKSYCDYIKQLKRCWGDSLMINLNSFNKEYKNQKSIITVECIHHGIFKRRAFDIISKRKQGCYECMKIRKSESLKNYVKTEAHKLNISKSKKGINNQTKEYIERLKNDMLGSKNNSAKLTEKEVIEIREKYKTNKYSYKTLGEEYGVSKSTVSGIIKRKNWTHI